MKKLITIIAASAFFLTAEGQEGTGAKKISKIKNGNVIIVPDQKPVIIEKRDDDTVARKENLRPEAKKVKRKKQGLKRL